MTSPERAEVFGREQELAALDGARTRAAAGRLEVALIEGEPGIGKSRLVSEAAERARGSGFGVWMARFEEMERDRSFGPLADALGCSMSSVDPRRAEIARALLADDVAGVDSAQHYRIADALIGLIEEESITQPRLLVLEDLHWADPASLYAVRTGVKRLAFVPLFLVATLRPLPRPDSLRALMEALHHDGWPPIVLSGLDQDSVLALAEELLGSQPEPEIARHLSAAGGNPLFVSELLDASTRVGIDRGTRLEASHPNLRATILRKISFLSDHSIELLRVASILGTGFSAADLALLARRPLAELMPQIGECLTARLLLEDEDNLRFRHDVIRESLYHDLPLSVRKGLHLEAARRLLEAGAPPTQVAKHFLLGAELGDEGAISALRRAGRDVSAAPETRIELLEHARRLHEDQDPEKAWTEADLADALMYGGRFDQAIDLARSLLERTQDDGLKRRERRLLARAMRIAGRWRELIRITDEWFAHGLVDEERALLTALRAGGASQSGISIDVVARELEAALEIGDRVDDDEIRVAALTELVNVRDSQGRLPDEIEVARRALEIVQRRPTVELRSYHPHMWLGQAYELNSMFDEAERVLLEGLRDRERIGTVWDIAAYQAVLSTVYRRSGRWDDAVVAAQACIDSPGAWSNADRVALANLAGIATYRGSAEESGSVLRAIPRDDAYSMTGAEAGVELHAAVARNDADAALSLIRGGLMSGQSPDRFLDADLSAEVIGFLIHAREQTLAQAIVEGFEGSLSDRVDPQMSASVLAARTVLVDEPSGYQSALEQLRAVGLWSSALLAEQAGACFARHGLLGEARLVFGEALDSYERLDAQLLTSRVKATMRSFGIRTGTKGRRSRPKVGWEALTEAEEKVVALAARGFTNPRIAEELYLSRYTVQTHLKNVFQKLGITSRTELAAEVSRRAR